MQNRTRQLAFDALLAAMVAVLGFIALDFISIKITFESVPIFIGALLFGPVDGLAIGAIGTLVYQLLRYGVSVTTPLWILPYALCGLLVGLWAKKLKYSFSMKQMLTIVVLNELLITLINTGVMYVDSKIYGYYFVGFIAGSLALRLAVCIVKSIAYSFIMQPVLTAVRKNLKLSTASDKVRKALRREKISARDNLSVTDRSIFSARIAEAVVSSSEFIEAETIMLYKAVKGEVNTDAIAEAALAAGKRVAYPLCVENSGMLALIPGDWHAGYKGIPEPVRECSEEVAPEALDLVICPCTSFDDSCHRLGAGGGFYDRFLPLCSNAVRIAVAFDCQKTELVPCDSWDVPMDSVITESTIYTR